MAVFDPRVIACPPESQWDALAVLYQRVPEPLRNRLIGDVIADARRGEVDLTGLWIARERDGRISGALLTQTLAGRVAAIWAPEVCRAWRRGILAAELVRTALVDLEVRGFRLAQSVLDESASVRAGRDLIRGGVPWVTHLLYLEWDISALPPPSAPDTETQDALPVPILEWRAYGPAVDSEFRDVLAATYIDSLDMPELSGTRGLDDILEGHRAAGRFFPERWQLGQVKGEPRAAAVLLLASLSDRDAWEIVYLGLTPSARGRGLGRAVLRHAMELARPEVPTLELAADERNDPALKLYRAAGFHVRDRRAVHLAVLGHESTHLNVS